MCLSTPAVAPFSQGRLLNARLLKAKWDALQGYDASTYTSITGQQPSGLWSIGFNAEATAAPSSKGIRYNGGGCLYTVIVCQILYHRNISFDGLLR